MYTAVALGVLLLLLLLVLTVLTVIRCRSGHSPNAELLLAVWTSLDGDDEAPRHGTLTSHNGTPISSF